MHALFKKKGWGGIGLESINSYKKLNFLVRD